MTIPQPLAIAWVALGLAGIAIWLRIGWLRREIRRLREYSELARHQALPPPATPLRRRTDPLPDDLPHGRDRLRIIARRRPK